MPSKRKAPAKTNKPSLKKSKSEQEQTQLMKKISDLKKVNENKVHVVDAHFFPQSNANVFGDFDCMLNKTDIGQNNNKFYVIQMIELESKSGGNDYVVWTRWGRVGERGQNMKLGQSKNCDEVKKLFCKKFIEKTGIKWEEREIASSRKGKYTVVDIIADSGETVQVVDLQITSVSTKKSSLDKQTYEFITRLFSVTMFNHVLDQLKMDTKKMPLGKLSSRQIATAFEILSDLQKAVKNSQGDLNELSSRFYTVMPHNFGRQRPPVINTMQLIQDKFDMLNVLSDVVLVQTLQGVTETVEEDDEITKKYKSLKCNLTWLDAKHPERKLVHDFFSSTKRNDHNLLNVWKVDRNSEEERFHPYCDREHHRLLWHGTNIGTVAAILHSGLRIMPHSGGLVGKGVYFASRAAKSQQYVGYDKDGHYVMFLAEVFLGKDHKVYDCQYNLTAPPKGFDSVIAQGSEESDPNAEKELLLDGIHIKVPTGPSIIRKIQTVFSFSEYLVYQESQIRLRYVAELK